MSPFEKKGELTVSPPRVGGGLLLSQGPFSPSPSVLPSRADGFLHLWVAQLCTGLRASSFRPGTRSEGSSPSILQGVGVVLTAFRGAVGRP